MTHAACVTNWSARSFTFYKRIKELALIHILRPECIVDLYKHAKFLRTREKCIEKHEAQPSASRTYRVFSKVPKCLYNTTMHKDKFFISVINY